MTEQDLDRDLTDLDFGGPATYRIVVQGALSEGWHDRIAGFATHAVDRAGKARQTVLSGQVRDQAELKGVIETLYGLHLPLVEVVRVEDAAGAPRHAPPA